MPNPLKIKAEVRYITDCGEGVYQVGFVSERRFPMFKAGQFLHLTVDEYDPAGGFWPESRVFSIASQPGTPEIEIIYSVKGQYTRKIESYLKPGCEVWLKLPYGDFIIESHNVAERDIVLIAGGTGISPFIPYIKNKVEKVISGERLTRLYYGARLKRQLLWIDLLSKANALGDFEAKLFLESEKPNSDFVEGVRLFCGRLDIEKIHEETSSLKNPAFFISGPPAMIATFTEKLKVCGVGSESIFSDKWE